jgi:hypothetical protein
VVTSLPTVAADLRATIHLPALRRFAFAYLGVGLGCWGIGAFIVGALILTYRAPIGPALGAAVFAIVVTTLSGDVFVAQYRLLSFPRTFAVAPTGFVGELLPPAASTTRGQTIGQYTPLLRITVARCPVVGVAWSDLIVRGSLQLEGTVVVLGFHPKAHRPTAGQLFTHPAAHVRVPLALFPKVAERMLQAGAELQFFTPISARGSKSNLSPFGSPVNGGTCLRLYSNLNAVGVEALLSSLRPAAETPQS